MSRTKRCFVCSQVKTLDSFYAHKGMVDGHLGKCKECCKRQRLEIYYHYVGRELKQSAERRIYAHNA
jgi:hypothetical protein